MNELFALGIMQPPGTKKFTITDTKLIYGNEAFDYKDISRITLLVTPTPLINGVAQVTLNGKVKNLAYKFADRERAAAAIDFANQKIDEAHGVQKDYKYRLQAHTGTSLEVYENYLIISFMSVGNVVSNIAKGGANGGKRINYADLTAIQFKEPAGMSVGFIQFAYPGSTELKGGVIAAMNDENSVPVSPQNLQQAREIVNYIEQRRTELRSPAAAAVAAPSSMDELRKLKELLDLGIVTQEEFDAKKKHLLGL